MGTWGLEKNRQRRSAAGGRLPTSDFRHTHTQRRSMAPRRRRESAMLALLVSLASATILRSSAFVLRAGVATPDAASSRQAAFARGTAVVPREKEEGQAERGPGRSSSRGGGKVCEVVDSVQPARGKRMCGVYSSRVQLYTVAAAPTRCLVASQRNTSLPVLSLPTVGFMVPSQGLQSSA